MIARRSCDWQGSGGRASQAGFTCILSSHTGKADWQEIITHSKRCHLSGMLGCASMWKPFIISDKTDLIRHLRTCRWDGMGPLGTSPRHHTSLISLIIAKYAGEINIVVQLNISCEMRCFCIKAYINQSLLKFNFYVKNHATNLKIR